jgi:4-hydroxybutyrate CoA-transferase
LQLGIGAIPDSVLASLGGHRDLGIHSEIFSDRAVELMRAGVVNGRRKTLHPGKAVATFLVGSDILYDFVDDNPDVVMLPVDYVNDPTVIARNHRMVSINSCIEVDLSGQVNAETVGRRHFSGVGGQVDFVRGARMSPGGRSIIAMPSTAAGGASSRIVAELTPGGVVTTSRCDVDHIVTEYGVAHLRGRTLRQRAEALVAIAHPDFREGLERDIHLRFR